MSVYSATTALPYPHPGRAAAGLRAELRHRIVDAGTGELPAWDTLEVTGPVTSVDARGRIWWGYAATMSSRPFGR